MLHAQAHGTRQLRRTAPATLYAACCRSSRALLLQPPPAGEASPPQQAGESRSQSRSARSRGSASTASGDEGASEEEQEEGQENHQEDYEEDAIMVRKEGCVLPSPVSGTARGEWDLPACTQAMLCLCSKSLSLLPGLSSE